MDICIDECPFSKRYNQNGVCVEHCDSQYYHEINTHQCVESCSSNYFITDNDGYKICTDQCNYKINRTNTNTGKIEYECFLNC